jgi:hypothetical protein
MVGITGYDDGVGSPPSPPLGDTDDQTYLWNFWPAGAPTPPSLYGAVYGWNAVTQTWDTPFAPHSVTMNPGDGFWVSFHGSGAIYPP